MSPSDGHGAHAMTEDVLSAYLDGELSAPEIDLVEDAVGNDPEWAATLADISAVRSALRALPVHEAPPGVWDTIIDSVLDDSISDESLSEDSASGEVAPPVSLLRSRTVRWIAAGAAAAAALALFVVPGRDSPDPINPQLEELADSAAARQSLSSDPVSELVPVGVRAGLGP